MNMLMKSNNSETLPGNSSLFQLLKPSLYKKVSGIIATKTIVLSFDKKASRNKNAMYNKRFQSFVSWYNSSWLSDNNENIRAKISSRLLILATTSTCIG